MTSLPWHRREPEAYRRLRHAVEDQFPTLHFEERAGTLVLTGEFQIVEGGRLRDRYLVEVDVPHGGPRAGIPVVREVGGRVPRTADRHVNPDGTACLTVPDAYWYDHPEGLGLLEFLRGPMLGYFVGQSIVAAGGAWPFGERAHGAAGLVEFYAPLVGTNEPGAVHAFLAMATAKKVRAHWPCPCGSRHRVQACHRDVLRRLRARLPRRVMRQAAAVIRITIPPRAVRR